jgi:hypothetical protein
VAVVVVVVIIVVIVVVMVVVVVNFIFAPFQEILFFSCPSICWKAMKEEGVRETKSKKGNQPHNTRKQ